MALYDEEELRRANEKTKKTKKLVIAGIVISLILIIALMIIITYLIQNPNKITVSLNGSKTTSFDSLFYINKGEDGTTYIYVPLKEAVGNLRGYTYDIGDGGRESDYTNKNKCYIENSDEFVVFTLDSDVVLKKMKATNEYERVKLNEAVVKKDDKMYIEIDDFGKALELSISYDNQKKELDIIELPKLAEEATKMAQNAGYEGISDRFVNYRAILNGCIIVTKDNLYGVLEYGKTNNVILNPLYEEITYIPQKQAFRVKVNGKIGIMNDKGGEIISPKFEELQLIDDDSNMYLAKANNIYGVINQIGNTVIPLEHNQIGINADTFKENGIKNKYILLNELIPVQKGDKWAFYKIQKSQDEQGKIKIEPKRVTDFIYDDVGCITGARGNLVFNVAQIEDFGLIVIKKEEKYKFMDTEGKEVGAPFSDIYIETADGKTNYYMITEKGNKLNVEEQLIKNGFQRVTE